MNLRIFQAQGSAMRKWAAILGLTGAGWMRFVILVGDNFLALITNYPGVCAGRWVRRIGIGPSWSVLWIFNIWLVLTSALEWIAVGLLGRAITRKLSS